MPKKLVIVESPTKAKTISKFLGGSYRVLSSFGHIRDLPKNKMGVDVDGDFSPTYVVPDRSKKHLQELKRAAKDAPEVLLATDEDREGEAIAWHIREALKLSEKNTKRIAFHEITKSAIEEALAHPRELNMDLVDAQQTRRILDRLVGYELSPLLWQKVRRGLSAGRVQSVALRMVVERERERQAFKVDEYWTIDAEFEKDTVQFPGKLHSIAGKKLEKLAISSEKEAKDILAALEGAPFEVSDVRKKDVTKTAPKPFTTSSLQIEANRKLGFSAKQTMAFAQALYETGRITYMRTDSMNLADKFLKECGGYIQSSFGSEYAKGPRQYKTKSKGAQEAHEAIRPTHAEEHPDNLRGTLAPREWKLYDLIWRRTIASQLPDAKLERTSVDIVAKDHLFRSTGSTVKFDGFMRVYHPANEKLLPPMTAGDAVNAVSVTPTQHFTEPPARFSDATLVKSLEEFGVGRPSTYAPTISTLMAREYIERDDNKKFQPTDIAFIVNDLLVEHFPTIVNYEFTAKLEQDLDDIAEGKQDWIPALSAFYTPFHEKIEVKSKELRREDVMKEKELGTDKATGLPVIVRHGRFGPFVQLGPTPKDKDSKEKPKRVSLLRGMSPETITLEEAQELLALPKIVGTTAEGEDIRLHMGPYGPYLKAGRATASVPAEIPPLGVDEAQARDLLTQAAEVKKKMQEPIAELGEDPNSKQPIFVKDGRFGPYVTDGTTNVSLPKSKDPKEVAFEEAVELLEKKRQRGPSRRRAPRKKKS